MTDLASTAFARSADPPILVYGTGPTPITILGAALGRREGRSFGWVHCAPSDADLEPAARQRLEEGSDGYRELLRDPRELNIPEHRVRRLAQFFLDEPMTLSFEVRLVAYLGMPVIIQRMVSRVLSADGRSTIVLTNLDGVPPKVALECFARPEVLSTLGREGVSVLATFRGTPPERLKRAFLRVYRVDSAPGAPWTSATVTPEEGAHPTCGNVPGRSLQAWIEYLSSDEPSASGAPDRRALRAGRPRRPR
jgi:hypothetical protein